MFTPSTVLRLLENVDIDNSYANTFSFSSVIAQATFFLGKTKNIFSDVTYMRKEKAVRVPVNVEALWGVSYLMFQNANFGNKWFYGFITDMRYIGQDTTEIIFEIDVWQTWLFDVDIKNCYIEREHVNDDTIGHHLVDENLNTGDYVVKISSDITELKELAYVLATTIDEVGADVLGEIYTEVYGGVAYYASNNGEFINNFLRLLGAKAESVSSIFTMPSALISNFMESNRVSAPYAVELNVMRVKEYTDLDGYIPKNNKLFTYPYNFMQVSNNHGEISTFKYELSDTIGGTMDFAVSGNIAPSPTVYLIPKNYKGQAKCFDEILTLSGYPLCSWTTDIYAIWCAQNAISNTVNIGGSALALVGGAITAQPLAIAGAGLNVANSIGAFYEKALQPNPIHGTVSGGGNVAIGTQNFTFYGKTIRAEFARIIDNYFDRFGYKVNELKTPLLHTRANWNYIKTLEINVSGNIPNKDLSKIHEIFNNGITFWHNDNVGNYSRANGIL